MDLAGEPVGQRIEVDGGQPVGEPGLVIDRQAMDHQVGEAVHQGRGCLEVAGLSLDECAAGVVELDLTGRPVAGQAPASSS